MAAAPALALFDLDFTLVPFDTGMRAMQDWIARGLATAADADAYLGVCQDYVAGHADVPAMHRALLAPVRSLDASAWAAWRSAFVAALQPELPATARALVEQHRAAGDRLAIVTATTRPVAAAFASAFGIPTLIATEPALAGPDRDGPYTGEIDGEPCHGAAKPRRVEAWLGASLGSLGHSTFYSDAASDLPLLEAVREPIAVRPDPRLRARAVVRGWRVLDT